MMLNKASWDISENRVTSEMSHDISMLELMMEILPKIPHDKKVFYTFGLKERFKIKPLAHILLK